MQQLESTPVTFKVSDFVDWQRNGSLVLSPSFQRRPSWTKQAKSLLIDTIARGYPVPSIFIRERRNSETLSLYREVVDGQQRLRTLLAFITPDSIPDFDEQTDAFTVLPSHNSELKGLTFDRLPRETREEILDYKFSVQVLPSSTADREILKIFARMNATGVRLNDQEIRNAEWFGEFKTIAYALAGEQLDRWRTWHLFTEMNIARMEEVELTSEFLLLISNGRVTGKTKSTIDNAYRDWDEEFPSARATRIRFERTMDLIDAKFDEVLRSGTTTLSSRTTFYSLFASLYLDAYEDRAASERGKALTLPDSKFSWILTASERIAAGRAPESVLDAVARRTTHVGSRRTVTRYFRKRRG